MFFLISASHEPNIFHPSNISTRDHEGKTKTCGGRGEPKGNGALDWSELDRPC